ncbi:MAG: portal protein [Candidatus Bathyarchaeia archaeon]
MPSLFGWEFKRKVPPDVQPSFVPKEQADGAVIVAAGGSFGTYVDLDGSVRTEAELVTKYRDMSLQPECDGAIDEIVNETMSIDDDKIVQINLDNLDISDSLKKAIQKEFENCLNILDFQRHAYEIYRRWYIDGRLYYHVIIDDKDVKAGIKEVRYIDPRKIRKIREIIKRRVKGGEQSEATITKTQNEYYIFNDKGFNYGSKTSGPTTTGLRIANDAILHVTSGLTDTMGTMVLSYLHKAIKPLNQLRTLEDALVIYRLARAPERRVWYIDTGNLPRQKAEQYVRDIMVKHKNRLIYDADSGQIRDDRKFMTMLEDYWLPRREGGKGTEVTTLPGGQTLGQMDDVLYFQKKFYQTLNVPVNRLNSDELFSLGRATEVTRDEVKFSRFIVRLRGKFAMLFTKLLEKQCVLKQIVSIEDWNNIAADIKYDFAHDSYFSELKDGEIRDGRNNQAITMAPLVGKYYSHEWVRKQVLKQTDDDIEEQDKQIKLEDNSGEPRWLNPEIIANEQALDALNTVEEPDAEEEPDLGNKPDENNADAEMQNINPSDEAKEKEKLKAQGKKPTSFQLLAKKSDGAKPPAAGGKDKKPKPSMLLRKTQK